MEILCWQIIFMIRKRQEERKLKFTIKKVKKYMELQVKI